MIVLMYSTYDYVSCVARILSYISYFVHRESLKTSDLRFQTKKIQKTFPRIQKSKMLSILDTREVVSTSNLKMWQLSAHAFGASDAWYGVATYGVPTLYEISLVTIISGLFSLSLISYQMFPFTLSSSDNSSSSSSSSSSR